MQPRQTSLKGPHVQYFPDYKAHLTIKHTRNIYLVRLLDLLSLLLMHHRSDETCREARVLRALASLGVH